VAVVVDLIHSRGAIRIYENQGGYVNGVGTEETGNQVIIPWDETWWFYVAGTLKVGIVSGN
jgi:hypothetical protein